jgi:hypothetical protein
MALYTKCGHSTEFEAGKVFNRDCYRCRFISRFGQRITVGRFGRPVETSWNHASNSPEAGMSCYEIADGKFVDTVRSEFSDRPLYIGDATLIDSGGDDEPIVVDFVGRLATKAERKALGV